MFRLNFRVVRIQKEWMCTLNRFKRRNWKQTGWGRRSWGLKVAWGARTYSIEKGLGRLGRHIAPIPILENHPNFLPCFLIVTHLKSKGFFPNHWFYYITQFHSNILKTTLKFLNFISRNHQKPKSNLELTLRSPIKNSWRTQNLSTYRM